MAKLLMSRTLVGYVRTQRTYPTKVLDISQSDIDMATMSAEEVIAMLDQMVLEVMASRTTRANKKNADSSRSHLVLELGVCDKDGAPVTSFTLVDLAGSEGYDDASVSQESCRKVRKARNTAIAIHAMAA